MRHVCVMSDDAHFRLRIPRHLKEWVEEKAKANNRSINAEILSCIELAKDGVVIREDVAKQRLEQMIDEAIRPFYQKLDRDIEDMRAGMKEMAERVKAEK